MSNVISDRLLDGYTDDFGNLYRNLGFKFEENPNFSDPSEITGINYGQRTANQVCSGASRLFTPRKIVAYFDDGTSVELPVSSLALVQPVIASAKGSGAICVALKGEKWSAIPVGSLGATSYNNGSIPGVVKSPRQTVIFAYGLEGGITINESRSLQTDPAQLFSAQTACLSILQNAVSCGARQSGIKLRHFTGTIAKTDGSGVFGRKIFVSASDEPTIKSCGATATAEFNCLGYQGTTIPTADIVYGV